MIQQQEIGQSQLQNISNKYDVTNLSGYERISMAEDLRDSGLISSDTYMTLVAPQSINEDFGAKTNYLEAAKDAFEFASQHGASANQIAMQKEQLDILEQMHNLS